VALSLRSFYLLDEYLPSARLVAATRESIAFDVLV
jgi:hypothetical protein